MFLPSLLLPFFMSVLYTSTLMVSDRGVVWEDEVTEGWGLGLWHLTIRLESPLQETQDSLDHLEQKEPQGGARKDPRVSKDFRA